MPGVEENAKAVAVAGCVVQFLRDVLYGGRKVIAPGPSGQAGIGSVAGLVGGRSDCRSLGYSPDRLSRKYAYQVWCCAL